MVKFLFVGISLNNQHHRQSVTVNKRGNYCLTAVSAREDEDLCDNYQTSSYHVWSTFQQTR